MIRRGLTRHSVILRALILHSLILHSLILRSKNASDRFRRVAVAASGMMKHNCQLAQRFSRDA